MPAEVSVHIDLDWSQQGQAARDLPCPECGRPTRWRTRRDQPYHPACLAQAMERELLGLAQVLVDDELPALPVARLRGGTR